MKTATEYAAEMADEDMERHVLNRFEDVVALFADAMLQARKQALEDAASLVETMTPTLSSESDDIYLAPNAIGVSHSQWLYGQAIRKLSEINKHGGK